MRVQEQIKEQIKIYTEMLRLYAVIFVALSSGEISLFLRENRSELENNVLYAGYLAIIINIFVIRYYNKYIHKLIKDLR